MMLHETAGSDPWHFPRPELAETNLAAFDLRLSEARGLFARRRMGKTEFLQRDLFPAATARGYLVAYTNLWDDQEAPDTALISALRESLVPQGVFSARLYGSRSRKNQKLLDGVRQAVEHARSC